MLSITVDEDLELRLYEESQAQALFDVIDRNRAHLRQWLPWLDYNNSVDDSIDFIKASFHQYKINQGFQTGIWYKGQLIGGIGYHQVDWIDHKVEIGYWLGAAFQGKGLMTKACKTLVTYAFEELQLNKVEIHCATENKRSRAIPERLNFKMDGILRENGWLYDHFVDHVVYSMLAREWQK